MDLDFKIIYIKQLLFDIDIVDLNSPFNIAHVQDSIYITGSVFRNGTF